MLSRITSRSPSRRRPRMSDYTCIICHQPCSREPFLEEKLWWFGIEGLRAIHHGCLEHLWDVYQAMQNPEVEVDDEPEAE